MVPADEPTELIDRNRFQRGSRWLGDKKEAKIAEVVARIQAMVKERGILVRDFFRDPEHNNNSPKHVNHCTAFQFKQVRPARIACYSRAPLSRIPEHSPPPGQPRAVSAGQ